MFVTAPPPTGKPTLRDAVGGFCYDLNRPLLCVAYVGGIALLYQRQSVRKLLRPLLSVGSMPLTNYIMQSVMATTVFYSHGLGLYGKLGPLRELPLALGIFTIQVIYSRAWMKYFRYGPLEWLWRGASYGKLPTLRR